MRRSKVALTGTLVAALTLSFAALAGSDEDYQRGWTAYKGDDIIGAMSALRSAADAGHAKAQALLGYIMDKAEFNAEAFDLYSKAAEQGDADGMYWLGTMYLGNKGVERNFDTARAWFEKAAEHDNAHAVATLAGAYRTGGLGLKPDLQKAAEYEARAQALREKNAGSEIGLDETGSDRASGG